MPRWKNWADSISKSGSRIAFAMFIVVVTTAFYSIVSFTNFDQWTKHTYSVLASLNHIETLIERAENSQRSFLLAKNPLHLQNYTQAIDELKPEVARLKKLVTDNDVQEHRVIKLQDLIEARIQKMDLVLAGSRNSSIQQVAKQIDLKATAIVLQHLKEIEREEQTLLRARQSKSNASAQVAMGLILLGAACAFVMTYFNRRSLRKALRLQQDQAILLTSIFDNMNSGLMVVDANGNVSKFNRSAVELIGVSPLGSSPEDRIQSGGLCDIKTGQLLTKEQSVLTRSLKGEAVTNFEVLSKHPDRDPIILNVDGRPLIDDEGKITGALALFQDITERKNLENEWQRAREAALDASRLKSEFLATMSHEIRTPMNGVIGMSTLLLDSKLDSDQKSYVRTIKSSADALVSLIDQILDHSKIEAGKLTLEKNDFNLHEAAESVIGMFTYMARSKNVDLEIDLARDLPQAVNGDGPRLRQILINLVGNALKFTEKGYVRLSAMSVLQENGHHRVRFEIKDTGAGMSKSAQANLFEKFSQVHVGGRMKYGGTGLGLTISKELTKLMKGDIGVESAEGFGSIFWFTVEMGEATTGILPSKPMSGNGHDREQFRGYVLVAEDQPVNQAVIEKFLQLYGVTCKIVPNGAEAFEAFQNEKFDLIFMDCQMPVMDGYTATQKIRSHEKTTGDRIPIVALTAEGRSGDRKRCFDSGMDDFLAKPLDLSLLENVLRARLAGKADDHHYDPSVLGKLDKYQHKGRPLSHSMIEEYLKSTPALMEDLRVGTQNQETEKISTAAHSLKGVSLSLGLKTLGKICEELEHDPARHYLPLIETHWTLGCQWLKQYAASKSSQVA